MIITRSPLRISLGGGGTDLPSYYSEHSGFLLAAAINKYVYITVHETFEQELIVKYSKLERVKEVAEIQHPIVREALTMVPIANPHIEIASMADIPAGTGLGSSGSFTTALLKALHTHKKDLIGAAELAEQACQIEIEKLKEPVGKQDQYIAAFGGLTCFRFNPDGRVESWPLNLNEDTMANLEDGLVMFYTGRTRSASAILKDQDKRSKEGDKSMIENLHFIKELGRQSVASLEKGDLHGFAGLMDTHWQKKKERSPGMTDPAIDDCYDYAMKNGALGGKLIGAGGSGFLMFYTENKKQLRAAMAERHLKELRFRFDFEGTKVVSNGL
jgi:D-glycero-alpha-D-manno-heptose-7-phosphate kinase